MKINNLNINEKILKAINLMGYTKFTEVQEKAIPHILNGEDIFVKSQTGSGKTATFAIPICQMVDWDERNPQALIIVPTRELAIQVKEEIFKIGRFQRIKVVDIYGKSPYGSQERALKERTHIVVGTPGRILDHIKRKNLKTDLIKYLILDEADEMLDMGFLQQIEDIMEFLPKQKTSLMFSATTSASIENLYTDYMNNPKFIEIESTNNTMERIEQIRYNTQGLNKLEALNKIITVENPDNCIIFCNTREEVDKVHSFLNKNSYPCDKIHGGMDQKVRTIVMENFKAFKFRYLIATDVAARGIDVEDITHVINYDIPVETEPYVHRIGRTGRKGKIGKAITLHNNYEEKYIRYITRDIDREIPLLDLPSDENFSANIEAFKSKLKTVRKIVEVKDDALNKGILKLHINAGKKTKMRAGDIVGAICGIDGVTGDDIGIINIIDVSSFVEILNNKGKLVLETLQTKEIKGRIRSVNIARR